MDRMQLASGAANVSVVSRIFLTLISGLVADLVRRSSCAA